MTETDILIVEDDKDIATVLGDFLRAKGYVVSIASDGKKALALYERYGARPWNWSTKAMRFRLLTTVEAA